MKREELQRLSVTELVDLILTLQDASEHTLSNELAHAVIRKKTNGIPQSADQAATPTSDQHHLDDQLQRTSLLLQLSIELRETMEPSAIVERMLHVMVTNLGIVNASVVLVALDGSVELAISLHHGTMNQITSSITRSVLDRGLAGWVLRHGRSVVLPDVSRDKRWIPYTDWQRNGSAIVLPIRQTQTTLGVLSIFHPEPNHFSSRDMLLMEGVAAQAGIALGASRRYQEENRRREQAMALLAMSQFLTVERTFEDLAELLQNNTRNILGADYGLLFLTTPNASLSPVAVPEELSRSPHRRTLVKQATVVAHKAIEQKSILTDADSPENPTRTFMALPLIHTGTTIGAVVLIRTSGTQVSFSANVWSMLTTFTNVIATSCVNMKLVEQLKRQTENLETLLQERTHKIQNNLNMLQVIFDHVPEGIILLDPQEVVLAANNSFCYNIIGRSPRQVIGEQLPDVWEELEQRGDLRVEMRSATEELVLGRPHEMRLYCTNAKGHQQWYEVRRLPVICDSGDIDYYIERWVG